MNNSPVEFFDNLLNLYIDENLFKFITEFRYSWQQKSDSYIDYFGSNYIGVYEIKFSSYDDNEFLNYFGLEKEELQKDVYKIKGINRNFKVSANCINMLIIYLMHKFKMSSRLHPKVNEEAMRNLFCIIHYKMISSLDNHYYKFKMDLGMAKAVHEKLNNKYYLKQFDSWNEILDHKFNLDVIHGAYKDKLTTLSTDDYVLIVNDMKTKLSSLFKNYYQIHDQILKANEGGIKTTSLLTEGEDGLELRDVTNQKERYIQHILTIYKSNIDLIMPELIALILNVLVGTKETDAYALLQYLTGKEDIPKFTEYIETMMEFAYEALERVPVRGTIQEAIYDVAFSIKKYYTSQPGINKSNKLRKDLEKIVKKVVKSTNTYRVRNAVFFILVYYPCRAFLTKGNQ